jgi:hypothetical protein
VRTVTSKNKNGNIFCASGFSVHGKPNYTSYSQSKISDVWQVLKAVGHSNDSTRTSRRSCVKGLPLADKPPRFNLWAYPVHPILLMLSRYKLVG